MKALLFSRSASKYAITKAVNAVSSRYLASTSSLELERNYQLAMPFENAIKCNIILSGICGSDIGLLTANSSRYFEPLTSFPFVPGHEVVAITTQDCTGIKAGSRVVIEPALTCNIRGINPPCEFCTRGETDKCTNTISGHLTSGLQTGYCSSTGGGWSETLYAHPNQLHIVPEDLSDLDAIMIEPLACAIHSVLGAKLNGGENICVIGAGSVGILIVSALSQLAPSCGITSLAKYSHQRTAVESLGAKTVSNFGELQRSSRQLSRSLMIGNRVSGGFDVTFDAVGSPDSIQSAIEVTKPGGTIILAGMPYPAKIDLTPLWHKQISLVGSYAYGTEVVGDREIRTFDLAIELAQKLSPGKFVSVLYSLEDFEEAINHARNAGSRNAIKIAFDPNAKVSSNPREEK